MNSFQDYSYSPPFCDSSTTLHKQFGCQIDLHLHWKRIQIVVFKRELQTIDLVWIS